ncbi:PadR family transcriptional regulator [Dermacoccaceae bacterium W4C1]
MSTSDTLLGLLGQEPIHGYTLKHTYDQWFAQKRPLAYGQVYASLSRFTRDGLAELVDVEPGAGPERRRYRITTEGVTRVEDWLFTPQDPDLFATSTLFSRVTLALLSGRDAAPVLDAQRVAHSTRMRELQQRRRSASGAELLAITYELAHLDADLRWIEESQSRLATLREEVRDDRTTAR